MTDETRLARYVQRIDKPGASLGIVPAALQGIADQAWLAEFVGTIRTLDEQLLALDRLSDPALLTWVHNTHQEPRAREVAINRLAMFKLAGFQDQSKLIRIATAHSESYARFAAVAFLSHQPTLSSVAKDDSAACVREAAVGKLADKAEREIVGGGLIGHRIGPLSAPMGSCGVGRPVAV